jgi:hypothetical protein
MTFMVIPIGDKFVLVNSIPYLDDQIFDILSHQVKVQYQARV